MPAGGPAAGTRPTQTNSRSPPPRLRVDAPEEEPAERVRQVPGDPPQPPERRRPARLSGPRARSRPRTARGPAGRGPSTWSGGADGLEDDARVAAPDVEDVGADVEGVEEGDGLLEQVRERQQRDDPVLDRRDDAVHRPDRRDDVVVGEHHALRRAGRARGEDELDDVGVRWARPGVELPLPVGREGLVGVRGELVEGELSGTRSSPASRGSGASRPVPRISRFASARAAIRSIASGAIRRSSGTRTRPARIAPK